MPREAILARTFVELADTLVADGVTAHRRSNQTRERLR